MNSELLTELPHIAAEKCVSLLLSDDSLQEGEIISLFTAFISFTSPSDVLSSISQFLSMTHDHLESLLKDITLDSIIAATIQLNRVLQSLLVLMTSQNMDVFDEMHSSLPKDWREQCVQSFSTNLKKWLDIQFELLDELSASVVSGVHTIAQLAEMKRTAALKYHMMGTPL